MSFSWWEHLSLTKKKCGCSVRYTGQTDVAIGTTMANRRQPEIAGLIGFFANTLVMRSDLSHNPTFRTLLKNVRNVVIEGIDNQDTPFEEIVARLQPERQLSQSPFFQIEFTLRSSFPNNVYLGGALITPFSVETGTAKIDITIEMVETAQGLDVLLEYNTDLFEAGTIHRIVESYLTLLEGILANPDQHLDALPVLTASERHKLLVEWNTLQSSKSTPGTPLHRCFEEQVKLRPDCIALVFEDMQLSYERLNRRANQLACYLQTIGVGPDTLVGICMDRSLEMVVGLLGILKAGGAYIPLDPNYPAERLHFMLQNAQASVLLTKAVCQELLSSCSVQVLCLDTDWACIATQPDPNVESRVEADHLAYVIYTSGSTGTPKGVMIEQKGMLNHLYAKITDLHLTGTDCVAQTASQCFDISVWQFFAALLVGGQVEIVPDSITHDPTRLLQALEQRRLSICEIVPSLLHLLLDVMETREPDSLSRSALRSMLVTGETLPPLLCRRWFALWPQVPLVNAYGPTECSDDVTHYVISESPDGVTMPIAIGRPLTNLQLYLLDRTLSPVPVGVYGEIYVGGVGVGRGYVANPQRTAEVFLPNPFSQEGGARLYKTGDLARFRPNKDIEYLGRIDQQVKIRGFRIELGEIEARIVEYPGIRTCAVIVREDIPGDRRLVAYVVPLSGSAPARDELRRFLLEKLPEYMVPAFYMFLESLPLTSNGKLDRKALPVPQIDTAKTEGSSSARTPIEEIMKSIYEEVLGGEEINVQESFFSMGGHSLLAVQVVSRVRKALGIEMSLRNLFETPSVAGLARQIEHMQRSQQERALPPIVSAERTQDLPLSFAQQRLWIQEQLTAGHSAYGLPVAVKLQGRLNITMLERAVREIVQRHESLRTTFVTHKGKPVQQIHRDQHISLTITDLHALEEDQQDEQVIYLLQIAASMPFDLAAGPLLRAGLFVLGEQKYVFSVMLHHIIFDAWSTGVFLHELSTLYNAFVQGEPSPLLPLPLQYIDFVLWQRSWLAGRVLDTLIDYWTKQLRGAQALELLADYPRTASVSNRGDGYIFELPSQLAKKLVALSRQEGVTLFMTLLTTFQILLHAYTGLLDIVVGTDMANRTSAETEDMIGFFINLLVLRTRLNPQNTFRETLKSVCATVLQAYTHQDLPFDQLVDALQLQRKPDQTPLVNVLFVLQNIPVHVLGMHDVAADTMDIPVKTTKFDVAVFLVEKAATLTGYVNYRTDLFHPDTIARMIRHFEMLLWGVVNAPDTLIAGLNMFTEEEKEQRLHDMVKHRETQRGKLKSTKRRITTLSNNA